MKKNILMILVLVIMGYASPSYGAAEVKLDKKKYWELNSAKCKLDDERHRLAICCEVVEAGAWDDFKQTLLEMDIIGEEKKSAGKKKFVFGEDYNPGESNYAKIEYMKAELRKTDNTLKRQQALELIKKHKVFHISQTLRTKIDDVEQHGPDMLGYIKAQQRQIGQMAEDLKEEKKIIMSSMKKYKARLVQASDMEEQMFFEMVSDDGSDQTCSDDDLMDEMATWCGNDIVPKIQDK